MPLTNGQVLHNNRYRIVKLIDQGGFGAVYRAWDTSLNMAVAVKENLDTSPEAQRQFGHEARILARLSHPHLPRVTDHFFIPGQGQYLVMDFVEGEDLQSRLDRLGPLPEGQVLSWINQVCDALAYLHNQNPPVIHRDLKPANIKIRPDGRAMLVDFGIAKIYDPNLSTTIGARAVTPGFSPPEQYGQGKTDARSDMYALGATLYTLLTGHPPPESVQRLAGSARLIPPRQINPQVTPQVEQAILRALKIDTRRRFQSAAELRAAMVRQTPTPSLSLPSSLVSSSSFSRFLRSALLGGVCLIVVIGVMAWAVFEIFGGTPTDTPIAPTPTPTGERIVFVSNRQGNLEIYAMNVDGSEPTNLTNDPASDRFPVWSPDRTRIAFQSDRDSNDEIYIMNANGSEPTNLTNNPTSDRVPAWSPDGARIAFESGRDDNPEVYVMNADGSGLTNLTSNPANDTEPVWSPDGAHIAFASNRNGNFEIYVMTADGNRPTNLTNNLAGDMEPAWSPDGVQIAFYSYRDGNWEIYAMTADGNGPTNLTNNPTDDWGPAWSPDGTRIAFQSNRNGNLEIYMMNANGSEETNLTNNPALDFAPAWSLW